MCHVFPCPISCCAGRKLCDFVMVEDGAALSESITEKAAALNVPIVSGEWGVQCLIHGIIHQPKAHALFQLRGK